MAKRFWLMKSEPRVYSIEDLERDRSTGWEGVRNYQARNFLRDEVRDGDLVLFYHSNAEPPGVAGVARVAGAPEVDPTQFDPESKYYDRASRRDAPRWFRVRIEFVERFAELLPLARLKADPKLAGMPLLRPGQRLSVQPVEAKHVSRVLLLAKARTAC